MINSKDFNAIVDDEFWKHITKETTYNDVVNWNDIKKDEYLFNVANSINNFKHFFKPPEYIFISKHQGILRRLKSYSLDDTSVYYYCIKLLQSELSTKIKSVQHVFGGFRLSPDLKLTQEDLDKIIYDPIYQSFAKNNFRKEWNEYQKLANSLSYRGFEYYIHIDIAHFYDDINLDLLESNVRNVINDKKEIIDLLFYFLKNSDKRDLGYVNNNTGIPQEEVGEMSRLLANFYLHEFDKKIGLKIEKVLGTSDFIYTRYADDMWFAFNGDLVDAQRITQNASLELQKIRLHINEKKLSFFSKTEFNEHWHFERWEKVLENVKNPVILLNIMAECYTMQTGRWFSPFSYCLTTFMGNPSNVTYISTAKIGETFLNYFITVPQLTSKTKNIKIDFFLEFFKKFPELEDTLILLLDSNRIINPSVEYFAIKMITECFPENEKNFDYIFNKYFLSSKKYYQWYSRVLCLKYINKHNQILISKTVSLDKLLNHLKHSTNYHNNIERRYNINFLHSLPRKKIVNEILENTFNTPSDLVFINYLSSNA